MVGLALAQGFAVAFPEGEEFGQQAVDVEAAVGADVAGQRGDVLAGGAW